MKFTVLTLFPDQIEQFLTFSILKKAQGQNIVDIECINIRDFAQDSYKTVDGKPYGGGQGMILRVDIVDKALSSVKQQDNSVYTILLDPRGTTYTQSTAVSLQSHNHIALLCGHYEGIDERIRSLVDTQISLGDYVITGGELGALIIIDSVTRLLPNVLATKESSSDESFTQGLLEYPQYTKPHMYKDMAVPDVLRSGNHKEIQEWKQSESLKLTKHLRPDLLAKKY